MVSEQSSSRIKRGVQNFNWKIMQLLKCNMVSLLNQTLCVRIDANFAAYIASASGAVNIFVGFRSHPPKWSHLSEFVNPHERPRFYKFYKIIRNFWRNNWKLQDQLGLHFPCFVRSFAIFSMSKTLVSVSFFTCHYLIK